MKIEELNLKSIKFNKNSLKGFDCVVIATDHTRIDYGLILKNSKMIFDSRNIYKGKRDKKIVRL